MGKKLDALFGRGFKTSKFKTTVNLAISRLAVLKNHHQARYSVAHSDIIQMLNLGHHERALLRVEQVIKEQNMLDVFAMIETYCYLLKERTNLFEQVKECPDELKEAIASMIYSTSRCGGFPELQELRTVFKSRFGKEFVARAVELRNNCGVNPKMIQKLSTRMPSLENKVKVLTEIALENNIVLQIEEADSVAIEAKMDAAKKKDQFKANLSNDSGDSGPGVNEAIVTEERGTIEGSSYSMKTRRKYKDVAHAAQAAFESAAYAATAARAAVELSRMDSHDSDDRRSPSLQARKVAVSPELIESKLRSSETKDSRGIEDLDIEMGSEKVHPVQKYYPESEDNEMLTENKLEESKQREKEAEYKRSLSASSSDSADNILNETIASSDEVRMRLQETYVVFDESNDETENISRILLSGPNVRDPSKNDTLHANEVLSSQNDRNVKDDVAEESKACYPSDKQSLESQAGLGSGKA